jgi:phage gpG-like protein
MIKKTEDTITGQMKKFSDMFGVPINTMAGNEAKANIEKHFDESQGPSGKWEPLSPVTLAIRAGRSAKPLIYTGKLKRSGKTKVTKDRAIIEFSRVTPEGQEVAEILNSGGIIKKKRNGKTIDVKVEAREYGYIDDAGKKKIEEIPERIVKVIQ